MPRPGRHNPMKTSSTLPSLSTPARERKPQRVDPKRMGEFNSKEVLHLLRTHSPCSRADLVRLSGLTAPTVSAAIAALQRRGLVSQLGEGVSNGGRPPSLLEFNAQSGYVVGVDIGGSSVRVALADLTGKIVRRWSAQLNSDRTPQRVTDVIAEGVTVVRERQGIQAKKILMIAAGAPGITDVHSGRVLSAPNLTKWRDVPLRDLLREKTHIPSTIENDVNLAALGESWCGVASEFRDFVFLAIGTGVGAGIVVNGQLHHGANWSAGEVGYLLLPELGAEPLSISRPGSLESMIGGPAIESDWLATVGKGRGPATCSEIFSKAAGGDPAARKLLDRTARHLANTITNLSLILDASVVVLGGGLGTNQVLLEAIRKLVQKNQFARPKVLSSSLGVEAQLQGAIQVALQLAEAHGFHRQQA
jgi:glucokinase